MGRHLFIGDVHGCIEELDALLAVLAPASEDQLYFVGDLVAKGPDSRGVVRRMRERGARGVRGNHDERCIDFHRAERAGRKPPRIGPDHAAVCAALEAEDWTWLEALPYVIEVPEVSAILVHAGLVPGVPPSAQEPRHMLRMRSIREDGSVSHRAHEGVPWASRWPGPETVVFGHDAIRGLQLWPHAVGLDTGCVYGGALSALELPGRRVHEVPAVRAWAPRGEGAVRRQRVCTVDELRPGEVRVVRFGEDRYGTPDEVLLLRDRTGAIRAYRNRCKHLPIPLDAGGRDFLADDRVHLMCRTHGAVYRPEDGLCIEGPCEGSRLDPVELVEEAGVLYVGAG